MRKIFGFLLVSALLGGAWSVASGISSKSKELVKPPFTGNAHNLKEIYYAGGCFWGVEQYFSLIEGVYDVTVGYANGDTANPKYEDVIYKKTGHAETVHVRYDPDVVSLKTLTEQFFKIIDPISLNKQGNDKGSQYRSGIYYVDEKDIPIIEKVIAAEQKKHTRPIATEFKPLENYYLAEEYHQDYLVKNPGGYCHVDFSSLDDIEPEKNREEKSEISDKTDKSAAYVKPPEGDIKDKLTAKQFDVTQNCGTEAPFTGEYWNNKEPGLYVDIVTGEPLFLSSNKYDSGTGWPSFTRPVEKDALTEKEDGALFMQRTEVRSAIGDSHLGHVFEDGPLEEGGLRYCINSASLRFVPYDKMEAEGYGKYKDLLKK